MEIDLPQGWTREKLGDLLTVSSGKGIRVNGLQGGNYPVYGGNGINGYHDEYLLEQERLIIGRVGVKCGVMHITKPKSWVTDNALIITPKTSEFNVKFFKLKLEFENLNKLSVSTAQPVISGSKIYAYEILLPSPKEQHQIVEKIEELFSELDKGIENLKTAQQQLKVYRQAVLKWAFVNDNFKEYILKDITEKIQIGPFGTQLHKEDYIENGIPLINPTHIKDGLIVADKSFTILESKRESLPNYILQEGDVIMGRRGEMGRCGLVSKKEVGWFCGTGSLYFRPNLKMIDPVFLYYNLRSEPVKKYLDENAGGTTMANLNLKIVNNIPISIPSIEEQRSIVLEIESRLSVCDKMEETITTSLQQAEALRQGILKRAFEGKLVRVNAKVVNLDVLIETEENKDWQRKVLAGKIIEICHKDNNFGHTKFQKTQYLCELHAQLDFNSRYLKDTAGPFDNDFFFSFIEEGLVNSWFSEKKKEVAIFFKKESNLKNLVKDYDNYFAQSVDKIQFVINLLKDKNTFESELIATIYAIWNNYIIENKELTFDLLTTEVYDWAKQKIKFERHFILSTWQWMTNVGLVPVGFGKFITKSA